MKKLYIMLLCATALTYGNALAQETTDETLLPPQKVEQNMDIHAPDNTFSPEKRHEFMKKIHEKKAEKLAEELKLTEEQKTKAKELHEAAREKMKPLMDELDIIRTQNMKDFENLLTPEQKEKFEQIKKERMKHHKKMMKHHPHHKKSHSKEE